MKLAALLLTSLSLVPLSARAADAPPADVIGKAGNLSVSEAEVRDSLAALNLADSAATASDPALLSQLVRSLLVQRLLLKAAESNGHDKLPATAAKLARARETALTESYLESVSAPPPSYPSESDLKAAYDAAKPQLAVPRSWRLAQIFIAAPRQAAPADEAKAKSRLDAVLKELKTSPAAFPDIAARLSEESSSAARGGEIGWLAESQIQPEIRALLGNLKPDSLSDPVRLDDGWHVVKVLDAREPYTPSLEQVRSQLAARLRADRSRENSQAFLARLLKDHPVAINELALAALLARKP